MALVISASSWDRNSCNIRPMQIDLNRQLHDSFMPKFRQLAVDLKEAWMAKNSDHTQKSNARE